MCNCRFTKFTPDENAGGRGFQPHPDYCRVSAEWTAAAVECPALSLTQAAGGLFNAITARLFASSDQRRDNIEHFLGAPVQDYAMYDSAFPIEFIGGSRDGEIIEATAAPDFLEVSTGDNVREIYERRTNEPPFVYVQIGYAGNETWK
jgi:hypothetical protein